MPESAVFAKLELAHRLREYRAASGITAREASSRLGFSANYLSGLERGREVLSKEKLRGVSDVYELPKSEAIELLDLIEAAKRIGWWEHPQYAKLLTDNLQILCGLEGGASYIAVYEGLVVTGLLQTEEYARAIIFSDPETSPATAEARLALRMKRQERLWDEDPVSMEVLLSQAVLLTQVGGRQVLREQLAFLVKMLDQMDGRLQIRIQPFEHGSLALLAASTLMFLQPEEGYRVGTVVWREAGTPLSIVEDPEVRSVLKLRFDDALHSSVSVEDSRNMMLARIEELG